MRMNSIAVIALAVLLLLATHERVWAWGQEGHSIIAEIANLNLNARAKTQIEALLGPNASLASISNWADDIRDQRPETYDWHFVDLSLNADDYDAKRDCLGTARGDCGIAAIARASETLGNASASAADRKEALMYLVHLVGDIHQPLHTVGDYRSANDYPVRFFVDPVEHKKEDTNLHAVWDSGLIRVTVWDWGAYVRRLRETWLPGKDIQALTAGAAVDWMLEAHKAARDVAVTVPMNTDLGDDYLQLVLPTLDRQLAVAGLRLARILNEVFVGEAKRCPDKPYNLSLQMSCSGPYDREIADRLTDAQSYVDLRAAQVNHPAVVLDIDETSLSNWPEIFANDFAYIPSGACNLAEGPCGDIAWELQGELPVVAPTLRLFNETRAKNVTVFFITGRRDTPTLRAATERNLLAAGYDGWTALYMRPPVPDDSFKNVQDFKTSKRADISRQFRIIANIGDQQSDLDGGYAERTWRVPNPFYYIP